MHGRGDIYHFRGVLIEGFHCSSSGPPSPNVIIFIPKFLILLNVGVHC